MLHPNLNKSNVKRIWDSGSGTGAWAVDAHKELPGALLTCTDVFMDPLNAKIQSGILQAGTRKLKSDTDPLPDEMKGRYDLVNQRFCQLTMGESGYRHAFNSYFEALRVGGYLQITESIFQWPVPPGDIMETSSHLVKVIVQKTGTVLITEERLRDWLHAAGFVDIQLVQKEFHFGKPLADAGRPDLAQLSILDNKAIGKGLRNVIQKLATPEDPIMDLSEYDRWRAKVVETLETEGRWIPIVSVLARKP